MSLLGKAGGAAPWRVPVIRGGVRDAPPRPGRPRAGAVWRREDRRLFWLREADLPRARHRLQRPASCEPLVIYRVFHKLQQAPDKFGLYWDYVKTNEKPYDELVVAVLVSFKHHFPAAALSSDGGEGDWARGIALYERATGRQAPGFGVLAAPREAHMAADLIEINRRGQG
jgi:hypothetical protein